ncbi:MAG: hypothetical protein WBN40_13350 [Pseudomonadales bacterium]
MASFCLPSASLAGDQEDQRPSPHWRDALGSHEKERALQAIARANPGFARRALRNKSFQTDEPALLLLEKRPRDKNNAGLRLADAYYYDYRRNETIHCIVDAETGEVHEQRRVVDLQLPLTKDEIQRAFDTLLQSRHRNALARAYSNATGQALIDINKINFKAYVFHASANSARLNRAAKRCGRLRCAQLLLYTHENIALNFTPVIDISRGIVLQANTEPGLADPNAQESTATAAEVGHDHAH